MTFQEILFALTSLLILIISLSVHEFAHAWAATRLGDDLAKRKGRLTLNPFAHIDLVGTILIPLLSVFAISNFAVFGWAKPVPFDPGKLRCPRRDELIIAMAGPVSNIVLATLALLCVHFFPEVGETADFFRRFAFINIFLAVFNLTPLPPLDGWYLLKSAFRLSHELVAKGGILWFIGLLVLINFPPYREFIGAAARLIFSGLALITGL